MWRYWFVGVLELGTPHQSMLTVDPLGPRTALCRGGLELLHPPQSAPPWGPLSLEMLAATIAVLLALFPLLHFRENSAVFKSATPRLEATEASFWSVDNLPDLSSYHCLCGLVNLLTPVAKSPLFCFVFL